MNDEEIKKESETFKNNLIWLFHSNLLTKEEKDIVFKRLEDSIKIIKDSY